MNITAALLSIYSDLDLFNDVIVQDDDDGQGQYIAQWNDPRPQPSYSELQTAELVYTKEQKIEYLKHACTTAIQAGFTSSALGEPHTYDSSLPQDQTNLLGAKLAGIDQPYTCTDSNGYKSRKLHTYAQIDQVFIAGMFHLQDAKARFYDRLAVVNAATTVEAVEAVVW